MTTYNALDTVHLIQKADRHAAFWRPMTADAVRRLQPPEVSTTGAWMTTVAIFQAEGEDPVGAAERLAKYLLTYQETHGRFPSLEAVQQHAADRHLKESR